VRLVWGKILSLIRKLVHWIRRNFLFRFELSRVARQPSLLYDKKTLSRLVYYWDNPWSAREEYLSGIIDFLSNFSCPVLECGSGLTTLIVGELLKDKKVSLISLEHDEQWVIEMRRWLKRYNLGHVQIQHVSLKKYMDFDWYDVEERIVDFPSFGCVICDGPPGSTRGGRYGVLPVMKGKLNNQGVVFLDDAARPGEKQVLKKWSNEFRIEDIHFYGSSKPYACFKFKRA